MEPLVFADYLPDQPDLANGATEAKNVLPIARSYTEFPSLTVYSTALDARCQGAYSAVDKVGVVHNYAGDAAKLYEMNSASWADLSVSGGYSTADEDIWSFEQYGEQIYATNYNTGIQTTELGSSSFGLLSSDAPNAKYLTVVRDFLVAGNTNDGVDGQKPNRIWWSAQGNPASWPTPGTDAAISVQSDYQDLGGQGGWVQGIIGGEYGVILQEKALQRMTYVGPPEFFQFDLVENARGTPAPRSIVALGSLVFYLGTDGFYMFDGTVSHPIGSEKVDRTFYADIDTSYMSRIVSAIDPINSLVLWAYPGSGNAAGVCNKILIYNWVIQKWSYAEIELENIYWGLSEGYTLDGLDAVTTNIDELTPSLDSRVWTGGTLLLSAFDPDHKLAYFTGAALDATLETGEVQIVEDMRAQVQSIRPLVNNAGTITTAMGKRNRQEDAVKWGPTLGVRDSGVSKGRSEGRYHRFRVMVSGGFDHALGVKVEEYTQTGRR